MSFQSPPAAVGGDTFPRQLARTRRFTLGHPRSFAIAADGSRVAYLRSRGGSDPLGCLWTLDLSNGDSRMVADPGALIRGGEGDLPPEERARRERARETGGGIVDYSTDRQLRMAAFTLAGEVFVADLAGAHDVRAAIAGPVAASRIDPLGRRLAFVRGSALHAAGLDGGGERRLAADDDPDVTWGLPDFIAAEEMGRLRGHWWSPDGSRLVAARVDNRPVQRWHLADPAVPEVEPAVLRYPAAGTANAEVSLHLLDLDDTTRPILWDRDALPYVAAVKWTDDAPLTVVAQSRDQRLMLVLTVDIDTGETTVVHEQRDEAWVDLVEGFPAWLPGGRLVTTVDSDDTRRLAVDGQPLTPAGLQVRELVDAGEAGLLFTASTDDPAEVRLWRAGLGGEIEALTPAETVAGAVAVGEVRVQSVANLESAAATVTVVCPGGRMDVESLAEQPLLRPGAALARVGSRALPAALLLPGGVAPERWSGGSLPVLLDPYGGPHAQRVVRSGAAYLSSQWFADEGFAVLVVDGRGTPGLGPAWERSVNGDLATAPLEDQVAALAAEAERHPGLLDLNRVAIRGWSFGGYLAALAVLRRPDIFAAAIAGAPVTDWALYDTHYTERYLGLPAQQPDAYRRSSLIADAPALRRPLLLIHGLADDNVVAAHTLRLSSALLAAGRPHTVLPLTGVTHMTPQETVAENLLLLQLAFLRDALGITCQGS